MLVVIFFVYSFAMTWEINYDTVKHFGEKEVRDMSLCDALIDMLSQCIERRICDKTAKHLLEIFVIYNPVLLESYMHFIRGEEFSREEHPDICKHDYNNYAYICDLLGVDHKLFTEYLIRS
jgi:hypothetical protein